MKQLHPAVALLEEEQARNRILRQVWLEDRARELVLERELRGIRATMRHCDSLQSSRPTG